MHAKRNRHIVLLKPHKSASLRRRKLTLPAPQAKPQAEPQANLQLESQVEPVFDTWKAQYFSTVKSRQSLRPSDETCESRRLQSRGESLRTAPLLDSFVRRPDTSDEGLSSLNFAVSCRCKVELLSNWLDGQLKASSGNLDECLDEGFRRSLQQLVPAEAQLLFERLWELQKSFKPASRELSNKHIKALQEAEAQLAKAQATVSRLQNQLDARFLELKAAYTAKDALAVQLTQLKAFVNEFAAGPGAAQPVRTTAVLPAALPPAEARTVVTSTSDLELVEDD